MIDRATVVGLLAMAGLLAWVVIAGAGPSTGATWQVSSLALVAGGALLATIVSSPRASLGSIARVVRNAFQVRTQRPEETIITLVALAEIARRDGLLALEKPVSGLKDDFLKRAMQMAIDGVEPQTIESVMRAEMESIDLRHVEGRGLLESMARFAPSFGMIGTLLGLVLMLGQMSNPSQIGPGMAVALLTTLYGLVLANVFCLPLARRLAHRSSDELLAKTIALRGVFAIQAGDNPRVVAQKLRAYLPAAGRDQEFSWSAVRKKVTPEKPAMPSGKPVVPSAPTAAVVPPSAPTGIGSKKPALTDAQAKQLAQQLEKTLKAQRRFVDAA